MLAQYVLGLLRKKAGHKVLFIATARMLNRASDGRASWFSLSHLSLDIDIDVLVERLPSCLANNENNPGVLIRSH